MEFFIAGYPKCGTTALYHYLKAHPQVFLPELKEPHYFSGDFPGARKVTTPAAYEAFFQAALPAQLRGDASASVIHSAVAMDRILAFDPAAKFVVLVREPVAAARSFHSELLYNLNEDEPDFATAWALQKERARGRRIPSTCREPGFLQYAQIFRYRDQLPALFERVPEAQRLVLVFEEFFANPQAGYCRVLEFLGLENDGRSDFGSVNAAKQLRWRRLSALHRRLVSNNDALYRTAKRGLSALGVHPSHILSRFNAKPRRKEALPLVFKAELAAHFSEDVATVERLLGRNLLSWNTKGDR
ncbi:sulfotransferase [Salinisphaera shabanensis T35B1]|uniref:sulfotransferase family protein n=1 Tax=Salinisphaera shabanensis TaxID=180542 RepID=UPI00333F343C